MGVARAYRTGMPYNGVELAELHFEQTADTMYLAHIDHAPGKLTRSGHTDWTFSTLTFGPSLSAPSGLSATATTPNTDTDNDGANYFPQPASYCVTAVSDELGEESRASSEDTASNDLSLKRNYNTIAWSAVSGANRYNVYKADNSQFFGYIGTTENLTFRDDNIGPQLDKAPPQAENPFDASGNYPSTVALFEQRLLWARTRNAPNGLWGSRVGVSQIENMDRSIPARTDDAFSLAIVAKKVNPINSLAATTSLIALTADTLFGVDGDGNGGALAGNSSPVARPEIGRGASRVSPVLADNVLFYEPQTGGAVRSIGYSFEIDGRKSSDVSIFSPHLFERKTIREWAYTEEPRSILWVVLDDGGLLAFTWEQEQGVWGWTRIETSGLVRSVCSIRENNEDRLYLLVDRELGGETRRFVERMASHYWESPEDSCYLDCAVTGTFEEPQGTFTGLWHLEGRTDIGVNADGFFYSDMTVEDGSLTLPNGKTASKVSIGIMYQVDVKTLPLRVEMQGMGSNLGRRQEMGNVVLQLQKTSNILAGIDEDHLWEVKQPLATIGDPRVPLDGPSDPITMENKARYENEVHVRQCAPAPFRMVGIAVEPQVSE